MLSRAVCSFSRVRVSGKTAKARAAAKLGVAFRQGYADPETRLVRDPDDSFQAGVWSWDGAFEFETGDAAKTVRVIPETLARTGGENGARLIRCIDGFEGQVWRESALIASRWWPNPPTDREWQHFMRAAQTPVEAGAAGAPAPCEAPFRNDLPLIDTEPAGLRLTFAPARVAGASACVLAMVAAFEAAQIITHNSAAAASGAQIEMALAENSAAIDARRRALGAAAQIEQLAAFGNTNSVARAFLAVASEIPADKARIANFRISDRTVEARIIAGEGADFDIPDLVSRLEKNTVLTDVFVERRNERTIGVTALVAAGDGDAGDSPELRD